MDKMWPCNHRHPFGKESDQGVWIASALGLEMLEWVGYCIIGAAARQGRAAVVARAGFGNGGRSGRCVPMHPPRWPFRYAPMLPYAGSL